MKKIIFFIIAGLGCMFASAQQDAHLTHYGFNNLYFNPAYAGMEQAPVFRTTYRNHWLGYQNDFDPNGAGNTTILSADMPILPVNGGAGLVIINDVQPSMRNTFINLSLSKHVKIGEGKLGIGVNGNYGNMLTGRTGWRPPDGVESIPDDNAIPNKDRDSYLLGDMSAGLFYHSGKKVNSPNTFYAGLSMSRLLESDFKTTTIGTGGYKRHMYLTGGYNIEATYDLILTPMLLYKTDFGKAESASKKKSSGQFEIGAKAEYQGAYWGGLNFRQGEAIGLLLGGSFMDRKQLKVGYAIDFNVVGTSAKALTSHEIMVAYYLPEMVNVPKPIIRTPRYKF